MQSVSFARRAAHLSPTLPGSPSPAAISFDSGHAFPGVLPDLTHEAEIALTKFRSETLQYAPRTGLPELRKWIAEFLRADGAEVPADNVLVTNGAKHAIELVCRALLDEGDSVVVTAPTYFSAIPILRSFGAEFIEVPQDENGLDVNALAALLDRLAREHKALPKFIYNVSDFHNPTGVTMPLERRQALVDVALRHRIMVVDDSPYRSVRFEGKTVPSVKSLDPDDCVVHVGTFSKMLGPGLRVGWAVGSPALLARMAQLKTDAGSCPLTQRVILSFCEAGRLAEHTLRVQDTYRAHRDRMMAAFARELPEITYSVPQGGYYLWLTLPSDMDGDALAKRAGEAGVTIISGSKFFARSDGAHPKNRARVAFSHATVDEIDEGVRRLASAYRSLAAGATVMQKAAG
ncbi:MAG TPA: PLP-dependent aminotransferase family protein [Gemmatimonadaceae bacterium]|nr:PLP-dependent aminotransferase family protein [Gemmatimonadaceae bacterium]